MRLLEFTPRRANVLVLTLLACSCFSELESDSPVACTNDSECPEGNFCQSEVSLCIPEATLDAEPPALVSRVRYSPTIVGADQDIELSFETTEALFAPPQVEIGTGEPLIAQLRAPTEFVLTYRVGSEDNDARVVITLVDESGNVAVIDAGTLPADVVPPTIRAFDWVNTPPALNADSNLGFTGSASAETVSVSAQLVDQDGNALLTFQAALLAATPLTPEARFSGALALADLPDEALQSVTSLTFEIDVRDALGNRSELSASRLVPREYDQRIPDTTLTVQPAPIERSRAVYFEFAASEANASFQCQVDDDAAFTCVSPLELVLRPGPHVFSVAAFDTAGNVDPSPSSTSFEIVPLWSQVFAEDDSVCAVGSDSTLACWGDGDTFADFKAPGSALPISVVVDGEPIGFEHVWLDQGTFGTLCANQRRGETLTTHCRGNGPFGDGQLDRDYGVHTALERQWTQLALARNHRCGIDPAGALYCWGDNTVGGVVGTGVPIEYPAPTRIGSAFDWVDIEVEDSHSCGLRDDGTGARLYCWGANQAGLLGNGKDGGDGNEPVPALIDRSLDGETLVGWLDVDLGRNNACGIRGEGLAGQGSLWCWGRGTISLFPSGVSDRPRRVGAGADWISVSVGTDHRCALNTNGDGYCWGSDSDGQLSVDGQPKGNRTAPALLDEPTGWLALTAGDRFTCGVTGAGVLLCFGERDSGKLGDGRVERSEDLVPVASTLSWSQLSLGALGSCGIDDSGELYCWGNAPGLGEDISKSTIPIRIEGTNAWSQVSRGAENGGHTCGVQSDGTAWCWAFNDSGAQLGRGDASPTLDPNVPARVGDSGALEADWVEIQTGVQWSAGIREDGGNRTLWWWGNVDEENGSAPTLTTTLTSWSTVTVSPTSGLRNDRLAGHLCGIRNAGPSGTVWCWGEADAGQLGNGVSEAQADPVQVVSPGMGWTAVSAGVSHTCGIRLNDADRELWCWGDYGGSVEFSLPQRLARTDWTQIDADDQVTCGRTEDGRIWAWGESDAFVGSSSNQPAEVGTGFGWVACTRSHLCAIGEDGRAQCIGDDTEGQLGAGLAFGPTTPELPAP